MLNYLPVRQNADNLPQNYQTEVLPSIDFSLYPTRQLLGTASTQKHEQDAQEKSEWDWPNTCENSSLAYREDTSVLQNLPTG